MSVSVLHPAHELTPREAGLRAPWWREYHRRHIPFHVITSDGVELCGVHLQDDHKLLLIYCHGLFGGKNYSAIRHWVELLASEMDVIAFDFRGHGESGGACTLGRDELRDLDAVTEYAGRFGYKQIVVMGSSMGGAVAVRYAAHAPAVSGVITLGAFAHKQFSALSRLGLGILQLSLSRKVLRRSYATRIASAEPPYDPRNNVARISPRPLLVMHGQFDPLIPASHAHELYALAQPPKDLYIIPRGGHDAENLNARTRAYLIEWLRTRFGEES